MKDAVLVYHLGAPSPLRNALVYSLREDSEEWKDTQFLALRPKYYRPLIQSALMEDVLGNFDDAAREALYNELFASGQAKRTLLSDDTLLAEHQDVMSEEALYTDAGPRTASLRALFPENETEFFLEVRNPALFLAHIFPDQDHPILSDYESLKAMRWSRVIEDIRYANPDCKITVWCNERVSMVWPLVLRSALGDPRRKSPLQGDLAGCEQFLSASSFSRLKKFLAKHEDLNLLQRLKAITIFTEKVILPKNQTVPFLDMLQFAELDELYSQDILSCKEIEGVRFLDV